VNPGCHGERGSRDAEGLAEGEPALTATEFEELRLDQAEEVFAWRFESLCRSGYDPDTAEALAATKEVDLHGAVDLVRRGCPPPLAARILL
jgi:hypothetical protein